jgi:hypothetical protein
VLSIKIKLQLRTRIRNHLWMLRSSTAKAKSTAKVRRPWKTRRPRLILLFSLKTATWITALSSSLQSQLILAGSQPRCQAIWVRPSSCLP